MNSKLKRELAALQKHMDELLPTGWAESFSAHMIGKNIALHIVCPICGERAPKHLKYSHRKWRWMSVHISQH